MKARPTTDMAREALFNVLGNLLSLEGSDVLDLFTGSGAVALECSSRGAKVIAVDVAPVSKTFVSKMASEWGAEDFRVVQADIFKMVKNRQSSFDLIFADPPYAEKRTAALIDTLLDDSWLKPGGFLVVEHGGDLELSSHPALHLEKEYGAVHFSFFRKDEND